MAAILNTANLNLTILDSSILVCPSQNSLTLAKIGSHHLHKKNFIDLFWLNLVMAAILNSAMLDSDIAILDSNTLIYLSQTSLKNSLLHSDSDSN